MQNLMVEDFAQLVRKTFHNDSNTHHLAGGEIEAALQLSSDSHLALSGSVLEWLKGTNDGTLTLAVPNHNSTLIGAARIFGTFFEQQMGYSGSVVVSTPRSYSVLAGIPPALLQANVPTLVRLTGGIDYRLTSSSPMRLFLKVNLQLPSTAIESPFPSAATSGLLTLVGIDFSS